MNNINNIKQNWEFLPIVRQLNGICDYYHFNRDRNASREELLCLLEEKNVQMEFTSYDGAQVELRGAIMHWIKDPDESTTSDSDSGDERYSTERSKCENSFGEANDVPVRSLAIYEYCPPTDFDVQFEEEVEAEECR